MNWHTSLLHLSRFSSRYSSDAREESQHLRTLLQLQSISHHLQRGIRYAHGWQKFMLLDEIGWIERNEIGRMRGGANANIQSQSSTTPISASTAALIPLAPYIAPAPTYGPLSGWVDFLRFIRKNPTILAILAGTPNLHQNTMTNEVVVVAKSTTNSASSSSSQPSSSLPHDEKSLLTELLIYTLFSHIDLHSEFLTLRKVIRNMLRFEFRRYAKDITMTHLNTEGFVEQVWAILPQGGGGWDRATSFSSASSPSILPPATTASASPSSSSTAPRPSVATAANSRSQAYQSRTIRVLLLESLLNRQCASGSLLCDLLERPLKAILQDEKINLDPNETVVAALVTANSTPATTAPTPTNAGNASGNKNDLQKKRGSAIAATPAASSSPPSAASSVPKPSIHDIPFTPSNAASSAKVRQAIKVTETLLCSSIDKLLDPLLLNINNIWSVEMKLLLGDCIVVTEREERKRRKYVEERQQKEMSSKKDDKLKPTPTTSEPTTMPSSSSTTPPSSSSFIQPSSISPPNEVISISTISSSTNTMTNTEDTSIIDDSLLDESMIMSSQRLRERVGGMTMHRPTTSTTSLNSPGSGETTRTLTTSKSDLTAVMSHAKHQKENSGGGGGGGNGMNGLDGSGFAMMTMQRSQSTPNGAQPLPSISSPSQSPTTTTKSPPTTPPLHTTACTITTQIMFGLLILPALSQPNLSGIYLDGILRTRSKSNLKCILTVIEQLLVGYAFPPSSYLNSINRYVSMKVAVVRKAMSELGEECKSVWKKEWRRKRAAAAAATVAGGGQKQEETDDEEDDEEMEEMDDQLSQINALTPLSPNITSTATSTSTVAPFAPTPLQTETLSLSEGEDDHADEACDFVDDLGSDASTRKKQQQLSPSSPSSQQQQSSSSSTTPTIRVASYNSQIKEIAKVRLSTFERPLSLNSSLTPTNSSGRQNNARLMNGNTPITPNSLYPPPPTTIPLISYQSSVLLTLPELVSLHTSLFSRASHLQQWKPMLYAEMCLYKFLPGKEGGENAGSGGIGVGGVANGEVDLEWKQLLEFEIEDSYAQQGEGGNSPRNGEAGDSSPRQEPFPRLTSLSSKLEAFIKAESKSSSSSFQSTPIDLSPLLTLLFQTFLLIPAPLLLSYTTSSPSDLLSLLAHIRNSVEYQLLLEEFDVSALILAYVTELEGELRKEGERWKRVKSGGGNAAASTPLPSRRIASPQAAPAVSSFSSQSQSLPQDFLQALHSQFTSLWSKFESAHHISLSQSLASYHHTILTYRSSLSRLRTEYRFLRSLLFTNKCLMFMSQRRNVAQQIWLGKMKFVLPGGKGFNGMASAVVERGHSGSVVTPHHHNDKHSTKDSSSGAPHFHCTSLDTFFTHFESFSHLFSKDLTLAAKLIQTLLQTLDRAVREDVGLNTIEMSTDGEIARDMMGGGINTTGGSGRHSGSPPPSSNASTNSTAASATSPSLLSEEDEQLAYTADDDDRLTGGSSSSSSSSSAQHINTNTYEEYLSPPLHGRLLLLRCRTLFSHFIFTRLYSHLFPSDHSQPSFDDELLHWKLKSLNEWLEPWHVQLKGIEKSDLLWARCSTYLEQLDISHSPHSKLAILTKTLKWLSKSLSVKRNYKQIDADTILSGLIYLIVRSQTRRLISNLLFIETFLSSSILQGERAYVVMQWNLATHYISETLAVYDKQSLEGEMELQRVKEEERRGGGANNAGGNGGQNNVNNSNGGANVSNTATATGTNSGSSTMRRTSMMGTAPGLSSSNSQDTLAAPQPSSSSNLLSTNTPISPVTGLLNLAAAVSPGGSRTPSRTRAGSVSAAPSSLSTTGTGAGGTGAGQRTAYDRTPMMQQLRSPSPHTLHVGSAAASMSSYLDPSSSFNAFAPPPAHPQQRRYSSAQPGMLVSFPGSPSGVVSSELVELLDLSLVRSGAAGRKSISMQGGSGSASSSSSAHGTVSSSGLPGFSSMSSVNASTLLSLSLRASRDRDRSSRGQSSTLFSSANSSSTSAANDRASTLVFRSPPLFHTILLHLAMREMALLASVSTSWCVHTTHATRKVSVMNASLLAAAVASANSSAISAAFPAPPTPSSSVGSSPPLSPLPPPPPLSTENSRERL